ncbi:hypothetical protein E5676_scaffold605G00460 [Cucumis melo var. makuwa]|uniref:Uncharacterized protein n=1 Tax=Cucumis melo var. makuwa TaxID=1194695 RepID=A0A5D3DIM8_CUCMM|nr:hypothetical protein E6C27_scaffold1204G00410 [Cucumis melo var. makuwa]TYK23443.1 hypothetical protein E5676_scaffold605G00460 [Cucumis melo var. makuwa]
MQSQPLQNLSATVNLWFVLFGLSYPEGTKRPKGNRLSLQTGELDKTVIFLLSTLSVLRDNDVVVEIELPVPDTLPTSAESFRSNSNTWLELYFESIHVEMYCKSQQGSLEETMSVGFTSSFELRQQKELEQVIEKFMKKFFMPHENAKRRKDITISSKMIQRTCKTMLKSSYTQIKTTSGFMATNNEEWDDDDFDSRQEGIGKDKNHDGSNEKGFDKNVVVASQGPMIVMNNILQSMALLQVNAASSSF